MGGKEEYMISLCTLSYSLLHGCNQPGRSHLRWQNQWNYVPWGYGLQCKMPFSPTLKPLLRGIQFRNRKTLERDRICLTHSGVMWVFSFHSLYFTNLWSGQNMFCTSEISNIPVCLSCTSTEQLLTHQTTTTRQILHLLNTSILPSLCAEGIWLSALQLLITASQSCNHVWLLLSEYGPNWTAADTMGM